MINWQVTSKEEGARLLAFLREHAPKTFSVKALKRAIDNKLCTVNQRTETFSTFILKEGDRVALKTTTPEKASAFTLSILYEDSELCIINKPVGVVCDPKSFPFLLVHRLDKETSGVLVLAKTGEMKKQLASLFKERAVRKRYLALVDGIVKKERGRLDNYLGEKHSYQGQTIYGAASENKGLRAITDWKCLKRGKTASLVACEPHTGRTHQLRAHLSEMGHPILGDVQYAKNFICPLRPERNMLHAYQITFKHPSTGKIIQVIAPIPVDLNRLCAIL